MANCQELNHLHVAQVHSKFHKPKAGKERKKDFHQLGEKPNLLLTLSKLCLPHMLMVT